MEDKSPRCRAVVLGTLPRLSAERLAEIEHEDAAQSRALAHSGLRRVVAQAPVRRLPGPFRKEAFLAGISHDVCLKTQTAAVYI